jgi:hypothetical protein
MAALRRVKLSKNNVPENDRVTGVIKVLLSPPGVHYGSARWPPNTEWQTRWHPRTSRPRLVVRVLQRMSFIPACRA